VDAFEASGLKASEFSRQHEMRVATLNRYLHKRARGQSILMKPGMGRKGTQRELPRRAPAGQAT